MKKSIIFKVITCVVIAVLITFGIFMSTENAALSDKLKAAETEKETLSLELDNSKSESESIRKELTDKELMFEQQQQELEGELSKTKNDLDTIMQSPLYKIYQGEWVITKVVGKTRIAPSEEELTELYVGKTLKIDDASVELADQTYTNVEYKVKLENKKDDPDYWYQFGEQGWGDYIYTVDIYELHVFYVTLFFNNANSVILSLGTRGDTTAYFAMERKI